MRPDRLLARVRDGSLNNVAFRDFVRLVKALGFEHVRTRGSHATYHHPASVRLLSIQPKAGKAKSYQIAQFLQILEEYPEIEAKERGR